MRSHGRLPIQWIGRPSLINSNESVMFFIAAITEATHHRRMCFSGLLPSLFYRRLLRQLPYSNDTAADTLDYNLSFFLNCRRRVILAIAPSHPYQLSCLPPLLRRRNLPSCPCKLTSTDVCSTLRLTKLLKRGTIPPNPSQSIHTTLN